MPILVSNQIQYKFNPSEITKLIANDLGKRVEDVTVRFVVQDTSDDRFGRSASYEVTHIEVTVNNDIKKSTSVFDCHAR
jgi:hypothetical protein